MTTFTHAKPAGTPTWVDLTAADVEAARNFYRAVFGWDYDVAGPEFGGYTTARLGQHPTAGLAAPMPMPGAPPMPAAWNLYFATDNLEADVARAGALGAKTLVPPMMIGTFGGMATCADPTGAAFGLWKAGQHIGWQVAEDPGAMAWCELYTPHAKQARDFYMSMLGATADPMPGEMEYYVLKHGEEMLGGIMQIDPSWGNLSAHWVPYFSVANTDATAAVVVQHGGQVMGPVDDSPFGRLAALKDPGGATFKIIQPPAA